MNSPLPLTGTAPQTGAALQADANPGWHVIQGPLTASDVRAALDEIAAGHGLRTIQPAPQTLAIVTRAGIPLVTLRHRPYQPPGPGTMSHITGPPDPHLEILIDPEPGANPAAGEVIARITDLALRYSRAELAQITASMPLTARFATPGTGFDGWALIFRDHYVENTLGFLLAAMTAGIPAEWICALAKGDRTSSRHRVHATLTAHGIASGLLDNTAINDARGHAAGLARALEPVDAFIDAARAAGRRVLVIDDGGLLAQGYGTAGHPRRVDAAVELTVSGLKRINAAGPLAIPVFNMARSALKTTLGYPEIAGSCLRRLRDLIPARKITGRTVLVIGYGALGSRLAAALAALGCQVHVADTGPLARITAAEAGFPAYRTAAEALRATTPFLIAGTTGDDALTPADLRLLPAQVILAPFATRDFALLAEPGIPAGKTAIPGVGIRYALPGGQEVTLLGDGRSLNLFEADAIPNQGYDAYRAGTLIAAAALCRQAASLPPGVRTSVVDEIIAASGLYDAYYDTYLAPRPGQPPRPARPRTGSGTLAGARACVIGYGVAGRLHAAILAASGAELTILDPRHQDLPRAHKTFPHEVSELPATIASAISLWSVCCPTSGHLPVLRTILSRNPQARVLLEKPACQAHEISDLTALLQASPAARIEVVDQYQHSAVLPEMARLIAAAEPGQPPSRITVTFTKDRSTDIARGRFIDRSYGVLGYEWLHMLAVIRHLLPPAAFSAYLASGPADAELHPAYDGQLFISALTESSAITTSGTPCSLELTSSITAASHPGRQPRREVTVHAGTTVFTARLSPAAQPDGSPLGLNQHLITAERSGEVIHRQVITDSPLHTALGTAIRVLLSDDPIEPPDLAPLRRIAAIAGLLRDRKN